MNNKNKMTNLNYRVLLILILSFSFACKSNFQDGEVSKIGFFNPEKDLLLANFDCKTDVDDLHSVAAFVTLCSDSSFDKVNYHAVAGTYGIQEGLYVPANELFQLAFGDDWTDAHENVESAVQKVKNIANKIFSDGGDLWIAEAGQSDFSAQLVTAIKNDSPNLNIKRRVHIVQHSDWNEKSTSPESLNYVKEQTDYVKIPDGNAIGNGSPGFRSPEYTLRASSIKNQRLSDIWTLAIDLGNQYNGKEGRYNNEAVSSGGLDFSDLSETCWILGAESIKDVDQFFNDFVNKR